MRVWLVEKWTATPGPWPWEDDGHWSVVGFVTTERRAKKAAERYRVTEMKRVSV